MIPQMKIRGVTKRKWLDSVQANTTDVLHKEDKEEKCWTSSGLLSRYSDIEQPNPFSVTDVLEKLREKSRKEIEGIMNLSKPVKLSITSCS